MSACGATSRARESATQSDKKISALVATIRLIQVFLRLFLDYCRGSLEMKKIEKLQKQLLKCSSEDSSFSSNHVLIEQEIEKCESRIRKLVTDYCAYFFDKASLSVSSHGLKTVTQATRCIYVGNHLSYLDVLLMLSQTKASFLAKAEIRHWPIIGQAAQIIETLFVQRDSKSDRHKALQNTVTAVQNANRSVIVFPEGTTSLEGKDWKSGALRIALATGVPVQPFRISYSPLRPCAFIGDDAILPHMWNLFRMGKINARIEFGDPFKVENSDAIEAQIERTRSWTAVTSF